MARSFLIKLGMLTAALSIIGLMGWTVLPDRVEVASTGSAAPAHYDDVVTLTPPPSEASQPGSPGMGVSSGESSAPQRPPSAVRARLDVNQATVEELNQLPGIGPALAQRIVDHRRSHGPFAAVDDLLFVKGIGAKKLDRLREFVGINNTKSKRETRRS